MLMSADCMCAGGLALVQRGLWRSGDGTFRFISLSYWSMHLLSRCRMLVWLASIRPLTRWLLAT